jgi:hypothetical protein
MFPVAKNRELRPVYNEMSLPLGIGLLLGVNLDSRGELGLPSGSSPGVNTHYPLHRKTKGLTEGRHPWG